MVNNWIKALITKLVEKKIKSDTEVKKNDFKRVMENFGK